jgi:hypothetical protein
VVLGNIVAKALGRGVILVKKFVFMLQAIKGIFDLGATL